MPYRNILNLKNILMKPLKNQGFQAKEKHRNPDTLCIKIAVLFWKGRSKSIFLISPSGHPHRAVLQHRANRLVDNFV